ncbi:hypothetical protein [Fodinibius saliphilus]|uniref:hypothetical protein n=1 Tax=Fodinibius saliphilus TaxID=1920650 RepID=UPI001109FF82|nr:hypothetical protein [Fodinibius saliphilus]
MSKKFDKRLFVPLNKEAFKWFKHGKKWEVRKLKGQYNPNNICTGRRVELRKGYNGTSLWGNVTNVRVFDDYEKLFDSIDFKHIFPFADSLNHAKTLILNYVNQNEIIAFKIKLDIDE